VLLGSGERWLLSAGKGLVGHDHLSLVATREHSVASSGFIEYCIPILAGI
jgi:hypothetical protein